jgi:AraC-like DNA-binding protein
MAMSRSTLNRKMKVLLNITINDYVKKYRLQKAAILLSEGHSVSEAAFRVGFESSSYFSQCFKEHFRQTPSEFSQVNR